jgi:hypothetical protein
MAIAGVMNLLFKADTGDAERGLKKMRSETTKTNSVLGKLKGGIGALVGGMNPLTLSLAGAGAAMSAFVIKTNEANRETALWASRLGVATDKFSQLAEVGKRFGAESDDIGDSMKDLNERIADAARGNKTYEDALKMVGLASKDLINLPVEEQFLRVADAIGKMNNVGDQNFASAELMADAGFRLIPMFRQGEKAIRGQMAQMDKLNISMKRGASIITKEYDVAMTALGQSLSGASSKYVSGFTRAMSMAAKKTSELIDKMRGLDEITKSQLSIEAEYKRTKELARQAKIKEDSAKLEKRWADARAKRQKDNARYQLQVAERMRAYEAKRAMQSPTTSVLGPQEGTIMESMTASLQSKIASLQSQSSQNITSMQSFGTRQGNPNKIGFGSASETRAQRQIKLQEEQKNLAQLAQVELVKQTKALEELKNINIPFLGAAG